MLCQQKAWTLHSVLTGTIFPGQVSPGQSWCRMWLAKSWSALFSYLHVTQTDGWLALELFRYHTITRSNEMGFRCKGSVNMQITPFSGGKWLVIRTVTKSPHCKKKKKNSGPTLKGSHLQRCILETVGELKLGSNKDHTEQLQALTDQWRRHMGATSDLRTASNTRPHGQHCFQPFPPCEDSAEPSWKQDSYDFLTSFTDTDQKHKGGYSHNEEWQLTGTPLLRYGTD